MTRAKTDNDVRLCGDFKPLNAVTVKDNYPLFRMSKARNMIEGAVLFSKLDCAQGFYQIPLEEASKKYTAFKTPWGLFEFNMMAFGLGNSPATFQRLMDDRLKGYLGEFCIVYLDDILVFTKDQGDPKRNEQLHLEQLQLVMDRLNQINFKLGREKCEFLKTKLEYLGHNLDNVGSSPTANEISKLINYPRPTTPK